MRDRTDAELEQTIKNAAEIGEVIGRASFLMVNPFWEFCAGIDAYFEKRKRKEAQTQQLEEQLTKSLDQLNKS
jgi:hypothetical protein